MTIQHTCAIPGCIQLIGLRGGQEVGSTATQQVNPLEPETLLLYDPGSLPFDGFILVGTGFTFDHWWITIIDP